MTNLEKTRKSELEVQRKAIEKKLIEKGYKKATNTGRRNVLSSDGKLRIGSVSKLEGDFKIFIKNPKSNDSRIIDSGELKIYLPDNSKLKDRHLVTLPNGDRVFQSYNEETSPVIKEVMQSLGLEVKDSRGIIGKALISSSRGAGSTSTNNT